MLRITELKRFLALSVVKFLHGNFQFVTFFPVINALFLSVVFVKRLKYSTEPCVLNFLFSAPFASQLSLGDNTYWDRRFSGIQTIAI